MRLSEVTTLRLGGPARRVTIAESEEDFIEAVSASDAAQEPVLIVAGGSNLVVSDNGFDGHLVLIRSRGIEIDSNACSGASVTVAAGENFDQFVRLAVENEWVGIEALAGVPGSVGATPIQNVGAYGQEVADTIVQVRTWDRHESRIRTFAHADCGFGYRWSRFKAEPHRYLVLSVTFQFALGDLSTPVRYSELAAKLGIKTGDRASVSQVREAVLGLRRGKGMVLDETDHDTWSAGSFFMNPIVSQEVADTLSADAPRHLQADGRIKTSAAWLIDHAGFEKGYGSGSVSLSTKHPLALTNRGTGTTTELLNLAREVRDGVKDKYGIELLPEPVLVAESWVQAQASVPPG